MMNGQVIEQLAAHALATGIDPVDFTAAVVEVLVEDAFGMTLASRDPRTVLLGRRIVGCLLERGWTMPDIGRPE